MELLLLLLLPQSLLLLQALQGRQGVCMQAGRQCCKAVAPDQER
jgi:hypothetical protein